MKLLGRVPLHWILVLGGALLALPGGSARAQADAEIANCEIPERAFELLQTHARLHYRLDLRLPTQEAVQNSNFTEIVDIFASLFRGHAKTFGYALGQQLRYVPPPADGRPSAEKVCWDLMDRGLRQHLVALHYEKCDFLRDNLYKRVTQTGEGLTADAQSALDAFCDPAFRRELQALAGNSLAGAYDAQMLAETGVAPGTAPSLFGRDYDATAPLMPDATTTIGPDDLKATPLGREVAELSAKMREFKEAGERLEPGSPPRQFLSERFTEAKAERDTLGEPLRGIRGQEILLYGPRAVAEAAAIRVAVVRYMIDRQNLRDRPLHAWFDRQDNLQIAVDRPRARDLPSSAISKSSP